MHETRLNPWNIDAGDCDSHVPLASVKQVETTTQAVQAIFEGEALLLLDGSIGGTTYPLYQAASPSGSAAPVLQTVSKDIPPGPPELCSLQ